MRPGRESMEGDKLLAKGTTGAGSGGGGAGGAGGGGGRGPDAAASAEEIARVAALMKIDIGERGGKEERRHVERVREMIAYFGMLDRAGGEKEEEEEGDRAGEGGGGWCGGPDAPDIPLSELRADEPEDSGAAAASYARVQEDGEGGAYVRAPQMSP